MIDETLCENCIERAYDRYDELSGRCFCLKHQRLVSLRGWCDDYSPARKDKQDDSK